MIDLLTTVLGPLGSIGAPCSSCLGNPCISTPPSGWADEFANPHGLRDGGFVRLRTGAERGHVFLSPGRRRAAAGAHSSRAAWG